MVVEAHTMDFTTELGSLRFEFLEFLFLLRFIFVNIAEQIPVSLFFLDSEEK